MEPVQPVKISNEELLALPTAGFDGRIVVVDGVGMLKDACDYLMTRNTIGFDTETRPNFKVGDDNRVALLQLSSDEMCFLFRLCCMRFDKAIIKVLENKNVSKIGADIKGDLRALQRLRRFRPNNFVDLQSIMWKWNIDEKSVRKMAAIVLGQRISKAQRLSNWEAMTLTPAQQMYAATDAWACLKIYSKLGETPESVKP